MHEDTLQISQESEGYKNLSSIAVKRNGGHQWVRVFWGPLNALVRIIQSFSC